MKIRLLYLYLFSFVGLIIVTIGSIQMVELGMKALFFKDVDRYEMSPAVDMNGKVTESKEEIMERQSRELTRQRQRQLANSISMLIVGLPLYLYHWSVIKKEKQS